MPVAIQEELLSGSTTLERFQQAREAGFHGIEVRVDDGLQARVPEIAAASQFTEIRVSAINIGHTRLIHPEYAIRDEALVAMRKAMTMAVDLGAQGVVFKPFYAAGAVLPDLHPYKSSLELEAELLVTQLRATLCDLAYALGTELLLQPANHQETHLIRKVEHGAVIRRKLDDHPHLKLAPNLYHMSVENEDPATTLTHFAPDIGYLYLSDSNHLLPGQGVIDFDIAASALHQTGYTGWLTVECGTLGQNTGHLPDCVALLRRASLL